MLIKELVHYVTERENALKGHDLKLPKPWTTDPIIQSYRFCNNRREDDTVTRWLKTNWRDPYEGNPWMTAAMTLARMVNWPETLEQIGFPIHWDEAFEDHAVDVIRLRQHKGLKTWSAAYMITTCGQRVTKEDYVVRTVAGAVARYGIRPQPGACLEGFWNSLQAVNGLRGSGFLAGQIVADLKHTDRNLREACDWWSWSCKGPGSTRGLNRFFGLDLSNVWTPREWMLKLSDMYSVTEPLLPKDLGEFSAQDWQNIMCEFDKYLRVKRGEGRPRQRYAGK